MESAAGGPSDPADPRPEVEVRPDVAVWLTGPGGGWSAEERASWVSEAQYAVASDFELEAEPNGVALREYLLALLTSFSQWDTHADLTFLRLRTIADAPVPVGLELYAAQDAADIAHDLGIAPPSNDPAAWLVDLHGAVSPDESAGEVSRERVTDAPGWERIVSWVAEPEVTSRVRYVRRFAGSDVVAVLRCGGLDPAATIEALPDLDDLAAAVVVGGES
ncbi:hypothetical protein [Mumia flava]|uniref:hypothetical protein n=1 Tax=Mumia flava TaxID=1348852 RepID=UPI000C23C44F|nr:hypothetical protein [Mumia flava]